MTAGATPYACRKNLTANHRFAEGRSDSAFAWRTMRLGTTAAPPSTTRIHF